jgi:hypothetical protein
MAIRAWSFTKFWTVSTILWFFAAALADIDYFYRSLGLVSAILGFAPAFLAGSWAGEHPEIARWPRVRLVAMWVLVVAAAGALSRSMNGWGLPLVLIGAPATIFTLRWYELTGARPRLPESNDSPTVPPTTPPSGSLIG